MLWWAQKPFGEKETMVSEDFGPSTVPFSETGGKFVDVTFPVPTHHFDAPGSVG